MIDVMITGIIILLVGSAIFYIVRKKKKGAVCIGCPDAPNCPHCNGSCTEHKRN